MTTGTRRPSANRRRAASAPDQYTFPPATITGLSIAGTDRSADIQSFFGSATLPAHGTLTANLRSIGLTVPVDRVFAFSGSDASG